MSSKRRLLVAGMSMVLMATLGACGSGGDGGGDGKAAAGVSGSDQTLPDPTPTPTRETVTGLREAVRHIARKTARATRPHLVEKCKSTTGSKKSKGSKGSKSTRKCTTVRNGTETYTRVIRQERWCVSLDDVNGDTAKDAVWYEVTHATYTKVSAVDRLTKVEFAPEATGCDR
ncbi:hypothetical protein [Streptomyces sp. NPDC047042]|uniref:hypothetical protein n=1 Tax=Streptomyces sp. NPDC047042 TaxID=3154807 RepID=UPI0033EDF956